VALAGGGLAWLVWVGAAAVALGAGRVLVAVAVRAAAEAVTVAAVAVGLGVRADSTLRGATPTVHAKAVLSSAAR
jgi:hypothetical protein